MKKTLLTIILNTFYVSLFSQSETQENPHSFTPTLEFGVYKLQNKSLQDSLHTSSLFNWEIGFQIGKTGDKKGVPFIKYNRSQFSADSAWVKEKKLVLNVVTFGAKFPLVKKQDFHLNYSIGINAGRFNNEFLNQSDNLLGFNIGLLFEKVILKNSSTYLNLSYSFLKANDGEFRDYDGIKILWGIKN